jgi:uncharacterized membrane protein
MKVDVEVETLIARPRDVVSGFAGDPGNAPRWYANIDSIEWRTDPPLRIGSRMDFVARFLGRRLAYTYEVVEMEPSSRLVMRTSEGPFPMETTYTWSDSGDDTLMRLRNRGAPSGFAKVAAPVMATAVRRATTKDLRRLKELLET